MRRTVSVIGLGFIGLPLAICLCERGFRVIGVDTDPTKINALKNGTAYVQEDYEGMTLTERLQKHLASGAFTPTTQVAQATEEATAHLITVGIPTDEGTGALNLDPLLDVVTNLGKSIQRDHLVILRSTVVPGSVETKLVPILEEMSGLSAGVDFHVAYAAERVAEGRAMKEFQTLDIVVGGITEDCAKAAADVLQQLTDGKIHITDLRVAQLSKVIENAQRDVNLAIVNELKSVAQMHGIDLAELIAMVNTHPRVNLLLPSVGVGGYCIPNAYHYLQASVDIDLPLFQTARAINAEVPATVVQQMVSDLWQVGKHIDKSIVAVLGLGMKDGSNDLRQSPPIHCVEELLGRGAQIQAFDPLVERPLPYQVASLEACVTGADAILVGAWQPAFDKGDWPELLRLTNNPVVIVDPRHRIRSRTASFAELPVVSKG